MINKGQTFLFLNTTIIILYHGQVLDYGHLFAIIPHILFHIHDIIPQLLIYNYHILRPSSTGVCL